MGKKLFRMALAALRHPGSVDEGLARAERAIGEAAERGARLVCFPETYIPGLRGAGLHLSPPDRREQKHVLRRVQGMARNAAIGVIFGMEWSTDGGLLNLAFVIAPTGRLLGHQAKNQITPGGESENYVPDGKRRIFTIDGVRFGVVICHEGWRYPETVRWAAVRGAQIVFQPQVTGGDDSIRRPARWGDSFYEKAMVCRAQENAVFFASVNTAMRGQNSATTIVGPKGECLARVPYGRETVLVHTLDLSLATRVYARRYDPALYPAGGRRRR